MSANPISDAALHYEIMTYFVAHGYAPVTAELAASLNAGQDEVEFSRVWYGNHLNPEWHKWTNEKARQIFEQFGLAGTIWHIPSSEARF